MGDIPTEDPTSGVKVKSIFCFAIAPEMQRKGIAGRFAERVCLDAVEDEFDFVEAYPNKEFIDEAEDCMGLLNCIEKAVLPCIMKQNKSLS